MRDMLNFKSNKINLLKKLIVRNQLMPKEAHKKRHLAQLIRMINLIFRTHVLENLESLCTYFA